MDVEIHTEHLFLTSIIRQTLETIFSVRLLAHKDFAEAQEARRLEAIGAAAAGIIVALIGIGRPVLAARPDSIGG